MTLAPANTVEGLRPPDEGPQDPKREKRPHMKLWDRIKFLLLFTVVFFMLVWASMANNPILPFQDAVRQEVIDASWLLVLAGLEVLRQLHYIISEHWSGYHRFWTNKVFGGSERIAQRRLSAWTRFRLARVLKWVVFLALVVFVASKFLDTSPILAVFALPALIWQTLPFIVQIVLIVSLGILQFVAIFWFMSRGGVDVYYPDDIKTRFRDVWGQDHVLARVRENIVFLERPAEIEDKGGYVPGGILLWGPPGTGKTLMAEAVAGETGKPYVFVDPGAFINMFFGVGILKVKSLFRKLRKLALRYGGVIVFFDEADSLGNRGIATGGQFPRGMSTDRSGITGCNGFSYLSPPVQSLLLTGMSGGAEPRPTERRRVIPAGAGMNGMGGMMGAGTLQALLTELSGLKKPRGFINRYVRRLMGMRPKPPPKYRILVMMATNMPEALDEALLRPGRIDRIYKVGYPSKAGRVRTYEGYFGKVRNQLTPDDLDKLATITPYATGASMKDLVNESLITAIREGRDTIIWPDVVKAKHLKELGPPEDVEYIERERHAVAIHEACHAVVAFHSRKHADIDIATIEKGSDYLGMVKSIPPEDQFTSWRSEFRADIFTALASLAGERMFFEGDSTSGVSGDLESATRVASHMEGTFGMGSTVSSVATARQMDTGTPGGGIPVGRDNTEMVRARLADRIEDNLAALLAETRQILERHRRDVMVLAHALETYKTLSGEDVEAVLRGHIGPLVDGRPYLNADLYREIEAYHRAAVIAHMNHNPVMLALPPVPAYQDPAWAGPRDPFAPTRAPVPGSTLTSAPTGTPNGGGAPSGYGLPPTGMPNGGGAAPGPDGIGPDAGNSGGVASPFHPDDH
jgi:ATP-dependent Zn protease